MCLVPSANQNEAAPSRPTDSRDETCSNRVRAASHYAELSNCVYPWYCVHAVRRLSGLFHLSRIHGVFLLASRGVFGTFDHDLVGFRPTFWEEIF